MNSTEREVPPIQYWRKMYTEKTNTIKFIYRRQNKKSTLPLFRERSNEEFLTLIQDFVDWTKNHKLNQDIHIE